MKYTQVNVLKIILAMVVVFYLVGILMRAGAGTFIWIAFGAIMWYFSRRNRIKMPKDFQEFDASELNQQMKGAIPLLTKTTGVIVGIVVIVVALINSIVIIPAGKTGVYHLFGKVSDNEISSGFHIVNPFAQITQLSIRTEEYTMSVAYGEGRHSQADAIAALTKEGLSIDLDITVFYRLDESSASSVYSKLGVDFEEKIIRPEIRSAIREVIAQYEAKAVYSEKREEAANNILEVLIRNLEPRGVVVEQVLLRNVNLPAKLAESIQEKLTAEQEAERMDFILDKEKKEAERKRIEAAGQRDAQEIINSSLTSRYLEYLYISSLKDREGTIYVPVSSDNGLPLFKNVP